MLVVQSFGVHASVSRSVPVSTIGRFLTQSKFSSAELLLTCPTQKVINECICVAYNVQEFRLRLQIKFIFPGIREGHKSKPNKPRNNLSSRSNLFFYVILGCKIDQCLNRRTIAYVFEGLNNTQNYHEIILYLLNLGIAVRCLFLSTDSIVDLPLQDLQAYV